MAFSDEIFRPDNQCEICGAELTDEVVIQEFADGSIAHLCAECAAGAALQPDAGEGGGGFKFPDVADEPADADGYMLVAPPDGDYDDAADLTVETQPAETQPAPAAPAAQAAPATAAAAAVDPDVLEKTRELLTPVVDLLSLQQDMQGALQRLATSLQNFATNVVSDNKEKTTVEARLEAVEHELEQTRARLREAEARLAAGAAAPVAGVAAAQAAAPAVATPAAEPEFTAVTPAPTEAPAAAAVAAAAAPAPAAAEAAAAPAAKPDGFFDFDSTVDSTAEESLDETNEFAPAQQAATAPAPPAASDTATQPYALGDLEPAPPPAAPPAAAPKLVPPPDGPPTADQHPRAGFSLNEVQIAQRYFNESQFTNRVRDVRKSLGKPKANLTKLVGAEPRALLTVAWDIIWYQYVIDLRRDIPSDKRVSLHREGMDLDELTPGFREKNSSVDDEGRLDASELEVKLLSDPSTLITEMTVEEERALEDATEEIWDQKTAPEFKWDD